MLGDLLKNSAVTLMFNSANCRHPYHKYLVDSDKLNNVELSDDQIILRIPDIKAFVKQSIMQQYSLYSMENVFWQYL